MLYDEESLEISVVSVVNCDWEAHTAKVKRRPFSALSLRVRGGGSIKACGEEFKLSEADVLFLPQNIDYEIDYTEGEVLVIHFECKNRGFGGLEVYHFEDLKHIQPLFRRAYSAYESKRVGYKLEIAALIYEILLTAKRQSVSEESLSDAFKAAVELIKEEYKDQALKISDICKRVGISDSYFRRMMKLHYGTHPLNYISELRVSYAENLLHHPSVSVERAALESGFSDAKYFARVVKKLRGCSPSELRFV